MPNTLLVDLLESLRSGDLNQLNDEINEAKKIIFANSEELMSTASSQYSSTTNILVSCNDDETTTPNTKLNDFCRQSMFSIYSDSISFDMHPTIIHWRDSKLPVNEWIFLEVVRQLLCACPTMAYAARKSDNILPLHLAALIGDLNLGTIVASAFPEAAAAQNVKGKTPLHFAAKEGHLEMVNFLLRVNPSAATIATEKLKVPLHFAAKEGHAKICCQLLAAFPDGASVRSAKGKLPLHLASKWGYVETVNALLTFFPKGSQLLDWESSHSLHIALRQGQIDVATSLIHHYPKGLKVRNMSGELPLDIALRKYSVDLVADMIMVWPKSGTYALANISEDDNIRDWKWEKLELCLRGAMGLLDGTKWSQKRSDISNVRISYADEKSKLDILSSSDESNNLFEKDVTESQYDQITEEDDIESDFWETGELSALSIIPLVISIYPKKRKFFPLHTALEIGVPSSVINYILDMFPDHIEKEDEFNRLPLHIALMKNSSGLSADVIRNDILSLHVEGVNHRDIFGRLPIHVALCNKADFRLIDALLKANPTSGYSKCMTKDKQFANQYPLCLATELNCDLETVYTLLRGDPTVATYLYA